MRKVILSNLVTLDGFFAGPNGELDWHIVEELKGQKRYVFMLRGYSPQSIIRVLSTTDCCRLY